MPESRSLSLAEDRSYDLIEQAMMESVRGRRFLAEFVRRNRSADTTMLLDAMGRLEQAVGREHTLHAGIDVSGTSSPTSETAKSSSLRANSTVGSDADFGTLMPAARQATADLLGQAETLQETAWRLSESGAAAKLCAELDHCATRIYAACSSQDALMQRMEGAVETLRRAQAQTSALDTRKDRTAVSRQDRTEDRYPGSDAERLRELARRLRHDPADLDARAAPSLDDLDRLSVEERLALFS